MKICTESELADFSFHMDIEGKIDHKNTQLLES